jgi:glycerophosphoryl diester phosphodiesterase|tara:strand:+ start:2129 stop:2806 length:678 start_codon:yes stop_codon:yes gene_type:complete
MLKIGHRGAKGYIAENTIESIEKAFCLNINAIEIDVHKCATDEILVFHDFTLNRITNGNGEIASFPFSYLKTLRVDNQFLIPSLEDVLDILPKNGLLNIELKGRDTARGVSAIISKYITSGKIKNEQIIVSSFQRIELEAIYKINPDLKLGVLTQASVSEALSFAKKIKAYAIHPNYTLLTKANVLKAQSEGYKVITWTVNELSDIEMVKNLGVDGIISDFPDRL